MNISRKSILRRASAALFAAVLLTFSACGQAASPAGEPSGTAAPASEEPESSAQPAGTAGEAADPQLEKLCDVLTQLNENVNPGTAGCSLAAVKYAAMLLDWGSENVPGSEEIKSAVDSWLEGRTAEELQLFDQRIELTADTCAQLMGSDAGDLMEAAGCESALFPWSQSAADAVEIVMEAAGLES